MSSITFRPFRNGFVRFWRFLDTIRRLLFNLLLLAIIVFLVVAWIRSGPSPLESKTALVLDLHGTLAEQRVGSVRPSIFAPTAAFARQKVALRDVLGVIDTAAADPKIERLVLALDDLDGAGLASLHEVAAAIDRFKAHGKKVIAWGSGYDQRQYFLAAHADEVLMHPFGSVTLDGLGGYRNYYRDALDKLGITVNLIRVGVYKSAAEPFIDNAASPAARKADTVLYGALWQGYTGAVEKARKLAPGSVMALIDALPQRLEAAGGDEAKLALAAHLVDRLATRDEVRRLLIDRGARDDSGKTFRQVSFDDYRARLEPRRSGDAVGVVVAEGEIIDGSAPAGTIGGESTAALIRKAREDKRIKAIVLRVDSPGGSVFGSELVRRELEVTRAAGKPIVVSMGDVAASGGYWISTASDEIIADASTVTGSIGVFGLLPRVDKAFDKLGIHVDGVATTWLRGAGDPRRPLDPRYARMVQSSIDHTYAEFLGVVAKARKTTPEKIDAIAQGRVWTGAQALERGLVDRLGSYRDALDSAAARAHLAKGYRIAYIERQPGRLAQLLGFVEGIVVGTASRLGLQQAGLPVALPPRVAGDVVRDFSAMVELAGARRPFAAIAHCMCSAP